MVTGYEAGTHRNIERMAESLRSIDKSLASLAISMNTLARHAAIQMGEEDQS